MSTNFPGQSEDLSDWISQAEAARLHGVSRQAIHKLVQSGRVKSKRIGGHTVVSLTDLEAFRPMVAGRPKADASRELERIKDALSRASLQTRRETFEHLRNEFPIHSLEKRLGINAEVILEAIERSGELTFRMIRGVIAEAAFDIYVVRELDRWRSSPVESGSSFDFLMESEDEKPVRTQVKLQRSKDHRPMLSEEVARRFNFLAGMFVVETQRTRSGKDSTTGESTRPYRFGEFDILAICLHPSTQDWSSFRYTVADWLIPKPNNSLLMETYQPISTTENEDWTDDFETCVNWYRSGKAKTIGGRQSFSLGED